MWIFQLAERRGAAAGAKRREIPTDESLLPQYPIDSLNISQKGRPLTTRQVTGVRRQTLYDTRYTRLVARVLPDFADTSLR